MDIGKENPPIEVPVPVPPAREPIAEPVPEPEQAPEPAVPGGFAIYTASAAHYYRRRTR